MIRRFGILSLLLMILAGCVKENLDECPKGNVALSLKYTLNIDNDDQFEEKVGCVHLYIFDNSTGLLVRIEPVEQKTVIGGVCYLNLPPGKYTIVAWGVSGVDIEQGGFSLVELTDPEADTYTDPLVGRTPLERFRMRLNTVVTDQGHKTPANANFNELYHAVVENIVVEEDKEQIANLRFTKNTNLFKVRVQGLEHLEATKSETPQIELFAVGTDDRYNHRNSATPPDKGLLYPIHRSPQSDIAVLRLDMELHKTQPIELHMRRTDTGAELMAPIDLLGLVLKLTDNQGELLFKTQEDLDRWDEFEIELNIRVDLGVTVKINGFEVTETEGELG